MSDPDQPVTDSEQPSAAVPPSPRPGAKRRALDEEQAHLQRVHDRVEQLRRRADARVADASADRSGSTFQARFERDVVAHHHATRAARYTFGDVESLAFGRLDLADASTLHIGRVSVVDEDGEVVLVDWRAPAAAAFYQATAAYPEGVARRRTLVTRGRVVQDLDDELIDAEAADRLGLEAVTGQGALLSVLARERTGTMRDIVATIQRDQDDIIRSPATGTLVVTGGPGTGKTVVALHRVASLLYRDRERFEGRGVLVIGPSSAFTEYTARVLPALGEDRAVQRPLAALAPPGATATGWDDLEVGRIKGGLAMVELCRRLLAAALPPIPPDTRVSFEQTSVRVPARDITRVRARQLEGVRATPGSSYHARRERADAALRAALWRLWSTAHRQAGGRVPDAREGSGFDAMLDGSPQITMLRRCYWPELHAPDMLADLATGRVSLASIAGDLLASDDIARLERAWREADSWTIDDVGVLDELATLIGPPSAEAEDARTREVDVGLRLGSEQLRVDVEPVDVEAVDYRDFAHVVVDEAQDLTPMQWRAVSRRGPYASWTVVGDLAQRSRLAEPATWEAIATLIGRREVTIRTLDVNYRTPAEIAEVAREILVAAGHDPDLAPEAVRATGQRPQLVTAEVPVAAAVETAARLAARHDGTLAIIAPDDDLAAIRDLADALDTEVAERLRILDARTAKGLEFDDVVVVEPDRIVAASAVGAHQLYVAVTRATRTLVMVAREDATFPGAQHLAPAVLED